MRVSRIHLENWRNFTRVDVPLQARAFLVGPNASGKSNFLDAFRFLRDLVLPGGGFQKAVTDRGGVSHLRCLAARRYPDVVLEATLENGEGETWQYRIAIAQEPRREHLPFVKHEKVWRGEKIILERPDDADRKDRDRLRQTYLEQVNANLEFRDIAEGFGSIRYYHIVPQLVREPERYIGRQEDPYGSDFLEQIARTSARTREARLRRILAALQVAVPQLRELELTRDERGAPHLRGKYEHWRPRGAWQREGEFSDGTLRLLGLLWSLLDGNGPILLEEPELSLHSEVIRYIPQMMAHVLRSRDRQIIVSTHSSDLLGDQDIAPDEVLLFIPSENGTSVESGGSLREVRELLESGLTVAEAVIPRTRPAHAAQLSLFGD